MKVTKVTYTRRFNVAKFEHEEYTLEATVDKDQDANEVIAELRATVTEAHGDHTPAGEKEDEEEENASAPAKSGGKSTKSRGKGKQQQEEEEDGEEESDEEGDEEESEEGDEEADEKEDGEESDEEADDEESEESDEEGEQEAEDEDGDDVPVKKAGGKKSAPKSSDKKEGKKTFRSKASAYDRENTLHKKLVSKMISKRHKGWADNEKLKAKAGAASKKMNGKEFLDKEGEIVPAFEKAFLAAMK